MTTLTVKIANKKQASLLYEMIRSINFVQEVNINDDLENDELKILEERWEEYKRNPKSGKPLEMLVKEISKKHGFKNNR